jgi:hypothetical protein
MVRGVSVGSRQSRKERRARRKRAELRESASVVLRESVLRGRNILRESVSTVLRAPSRISRNVLRNASRAGRSLLITVVHTSSRSAMRDLLLFVALLSSAAAVVASVLADKIELATLFCLLVLVLCAALWVKGHREPPKK